jgi:transcription antitermination factor NusG
MATMHATFSQESLIDEPIARDEPRWYAAYICANHEKRVAHQFTQQSIEHFLPLFEAVRRWKDRRKRLQLPLFPGYLFVRFALRDRLNILQVPSVVRLVGFNGRPTPVEDHQIETLQETLTPQLKVRPHPYLAVGKKVRIIRGPLQGTDGVLVRRKSVWRVVLSINLIVRAASVEVEADDIEVI